MLGFSLDIPTRARIRQSSGGGGGGVTPPVDYGTDFVMVVTTTAPSETFSVPAASNVGTYAANVDWGDGSSSTVSAYNDANLVHVYATPGDHVIRISGTFPWIYFNNSGDKLKLKLKQVVQLGHVGMKRLKNSFFGCANLTQFSSGVCDTSAVGDASSMLYNSAVVAPDISTLDTSAVSRMAYAFRASTITDIVGLESLALTGLSFTYGLNLFVHSGTLPTSRYDQVLINWAAQDLASRPAQSPSFGSAKYTPGGAAEAARTYLIGTLGWTIADGGPA
jgi:hypothetical protein